MNANVRWVGRTEVSIARLFSGRQRKAGHEVKRFRSAVPVDTPIYSCRRSDDQTTVKLDRLSLPGSRGSSGVGGRLLL